MVVLSPIRERHFSALKMRERRRQGKRHLKSEFLVFQSSSRLFHLAYFVKCGDELLIALSKSAKRSKFRHFLFTSSIKHEIGYFQVVVLQKQQRNVQKSVMHVQSCCFAYQTYCIFWHSLAVDVADLKALVKNVISTTSDPLLASLGDNYGIGFSLCTSKTCVSARSLSLPSLYVCHPSVFDIQPTYQRDYSDLVFTPIPRFWQKVDYFRIKGLIWSSYAVLLF